MNPIDRRINELHQETERLVNEREQLLANIKQIETRLTQIMGGLSELNYMKGALNEIGKSNWASISHSTHEVEQSRSADEISSKSVK